MAASSCLIHVISSGIAQFGKPAALSTLAGRLRSVLLRPAFSSGLPLSIAKDDFCGLVLRSSGSRGLCIQRGEVQLPEPEADYPHRGLSSPAGMALTVRNTGSIVDCGGKST